MLDALSVPMPTLPVEMFTNMLAYCWAVERDMAAATATGNGQLATGARLTTAWARALE
jgi:hypothetical protein